MIDDTSYASRDPLIRAACRMVHAVREHSHSGYAIPRDALIEQLSHKLGSQSAVAHLGHVLEDEDCLAEIKREVAEEEKEETR